MTPRDENGFSTCAPYCECDECVMDRARLCECCDSADARWRGYAEGYFCDACDGIPCSAHPDADDIDEADEEHGCAECQHVGEACTRHGERGT